MRFRSLFCALCVFGGAARAQGTATIRGEVVQADTVTRVAGIVVVAMDSVGYEAARALSGQSGTFSLTVPAPARYTLRALRIGYRPTIMPPVSVDTGEVRVVRVVLAGTALQLNLVRVEGQKGSCRISEERGIFVASLWEQARTGLTASTLSAGGRPFDATLASYRQFTARGQRAVEAETLKIITQKSTSGFHSLPAELLAASGYATVQGSAVSYHAPDANALLSPLFEESHCFDAKLDAAAHPDWIGIAFRPAKRTQLTDVEGTLWLDRATNELRTLEYRYTNPPRNAAGEPAEGRVDFMRLLTGDWIISRWWIRTPETEMEVGAGRFTRFRVLGSRTVGGVTQRVQQDGIEFYKAAGPSLTVVVRSRDVINNVRSAYVGLVGTLHDALADSTGVGTIRGFVPGTYKVVAATPFMTRIGAPPVQREVTIQDGAHERVEIQLPPVDDAIESACGRTSRMFLAFGTVQNAAKRPVAGARLLFEWVTTSQSGMNRRSVMRTPASRDVTTDVDGHWKLCLPSVAGITLRVSRNDQVVLQRALADLLAGRNRPIMLSVP